MFATALLCLALGAATGRAAAEPVHEHSVDLLAIGAGIMAETLVALLKEISPTTTVEIYESLDSVALESSGTMKNAGTGHSALCELNYTPQNPDGTVDITKAVKIMEAFEVSKQFWAYLVQRGLLGRPGAFINAVPHLSWVKGEADVDFLRRRFNALKKNNLFSDLEYTESHEDLARWIPVITEGRDPAQPMAATRSFLGTDIDFGALTQLLHDHLVRARRVPIHLNHEVRGLRQNEDGTWRVEIRDHITNTDKVVTAKKIFIGAGGGTLPLLQRSGVEEARGYGGFPVSGQFLVSSNQELANRHYGKVYGQAPVGAPPMSVPHLDTRVIDGKKALIFGPFAGMTTKFLTHSSNLDLLRSMRADNLSTMLTAGLQNIPLVGYLLTQASMSHEARMNALREFIPGADSDEWTLVPAGQRVQILKDDPEVEGEDILRFGTEVVSARDGSLAALLGASPGASTSVSTMIDVMKHIFPELMGSALTRRKFLDLIPSYGQRLSSNIPLTKVVRAWTSAVLGLHPVVSCRASLEPARRTP